MQVTWFGHQGSALQRELTDLVLAGTKTATAGLLVELELDGDEMPVPGMREAIRDADGNVPCVIETTECRVVRMAEVDDQFARDEGEGFAGAADWRVAHERFWNDDLAEIRDRLGDPAWSLIDDTQVICQRFRVIERYDPPIPAG